MAVNPLLVKAAVQVLSSKEGRKTAMTCVLTVIAILLLIICLFAYILSAPFEYLSDKFQLSGQEQETLQNAQIQYKDYIKPENKIVDRGGYYPYPNDGTTGSRGFSAAPVKHPVLGISRPHWGQDFNSEWHSNIYTIADGQVYDLGINEEAGMYITIYHNVNGKKFFTRYIHLSAIHALPDSTVKQGDVIASEGGEPKKEEGKPYDYYPGTSTGHHLHFEVREGGTYSSAVPVDPKLYIDPIPVKISCTASAADGSITIKITGGRDRGYEVSIDGGVSWTAACSSTHTISGLNAGTYRVSARDASYPGNKSGIAEIRIGREPQK
ncbi:murein DD-endopeptidase MepM/ murein hydrolase activator NlpD [Ruminiclostridium sufflavum DSM 19573]|uniref:Murein DD-endopeptidase MepM/ murein hydrolase activator NlpD n=1 Tax=Ruminiclostridium sufflavum DSM 19573 TaxID=1121337 RepID=A0A318XIP5_9FIRM|nr:M23 family metallopeptidase [Ruminiclostridium sufflavum]PYG84335.1 murein DD-endopeptidase MepM/ murein hydrolase activator NlpD [Ruminiclostridium sufflavum DSM 19573]